MYSPFLPTLTRDCIIYGLDGAVKTSIEIQSCPTCMHRYIGPDCRSMGLFNWNNRTLLTHDLLDDYTSQFTTSETPFIAWVTIMSRRYEARSIPFTFISDRLFRAIWFSYIRLVQLENDMCCSICGPNPEAVIVDGVTLAFNRKNLLPTLNPPTNLHPDSIQKDLVQQVPNLQFITSAQLRSRIRDVLKGPQLSNLPDMNIGDIRFDAEIVSDTRNIKANSMETRLKIIPAIISELGTVDDNLSKFFDRCYGPTALLKNVKTPAVYKKLVLQV